MKRGEVGSSPEGKVPSEISIRNLLKGSEWEAAAEADFLVKRTFSVLYLCRLWVEVNMVEVEGDVSVRNT